MIDVNQTEQVVLNLVLNSRDALPGGGAIRIDISHVTLATSDMPTDRGRSAGPYVRLRVADNGTGIPPDARAHLFEPFFTTKAPEHGTGLGLASVYGIVHQSGGFIVVDDSPAGGTVFSLYFPAVAPARIESDRGVLTGRETILLVEDEEAVRVVVGALLRRDGYQVLEAGAPSAAWEIFARHVNDIDLVVSDVVMPEMNGPSLARRCMQEKSDLRVLFMSGYAQDPSPAALVGPHVGFLAKPFRATALAKAVREILDRPAEQKSKGRS
jgi:two-component system cell cycle sensor histidine kinase/response regulator CckA